jgi:predicted phosphodiesterase
MIFFCGDPHGHTRHILACAAKLNPSSIILLGDIEAPAPLEHLMGQWSKKTWFIHGNHDCDHESSISNLWDSELAERNVHGKVVTLPCGRRLAGLGGVFKGKVWYPRGPQAEVIRFNDPESHIRHTPHQDRFRGRQHLSQWDTIYPSEVDALTAQRADILITHEAPGYHPHGFDVLDVVAQSMKAGVSVHGHHHDALDSSARWESQGFRSYGVGLRGVSALHDDGRWEVVLPGEWDHQMARSRTLLEE